MSAPIEQKVDLAILAIKRLMGRDVIEFQIQPDANKSADENVIEMENTYADLEDVLAGLCSAKDRILEAQNEWTDLTQKCNQADRTELENRIKTFATQRAFIALVGEAEIRLEKLRKIKNNLAGTIRLKKREAKKAQPVAAAAVTTIKPATISIQHEPLKVGIFTGTNPDFWPECWELYKSIHEDEYLADGRKFLYLRSYIPKGSPAAELIAGLTPTDYNLAIDLLKEAFGNNKRRVRKLQQELLYQPKCHSLADIRKLSNNIERICRQLAALGQDTDDQVFTNMLECKLTPVVLRAILGEKKKDEDYWSTTKFRAKLKEVINKEREISEILTAKSEMKLTPKMANKYPQAEDKWIAEPLEEIIMGPTSSPNKMDVSGDDSSEIDPQNPEIESSP